MLTRFVVLGFTLLMATSFVNSVTAETLPLKCAIAGSFTDGVETHLDTNGDGLSANLSQGVVKCNVGSGISHEEIEWIESPVSACPNKPGMIEFHISPTQGQHRSVSTDTKTTDQLFAQVTLGTLCFDSSTGKGTVTTEGKYLGGTGKNAGATGSFTSQSSLSYLAFGFKDGVFGGFGQFTGTLKGTLIRPKDDDE